jgi:hypothetical protein
MHFRERPKADRSGQKSILVLSNSAKADTEGKSLCFDGVGKRSAFQPPDLQDDVRS